MLTTLIAGLTMMEQGRPTSIDKWMPTRWTRDAVEGRAWTEYPRPQLVRENWLNLNGKWNYAIAPKDATRVEPQGKINVPYPIQSHLSGVQKQVYADQALWYWHNFEVPTNWKGQRVRLNFGAVDWLAEIYVNGKKVGEHFGGYDPFSLDITDALKSGSNEVSLKVTDATTDGDQPYGKQSFKPEGIWYTAVTGIWQTVWIEPVSTTSLASVYAETKVSGEVKVNPVLNGKGDGLTMHITAVLNGSDVATAEGPATGAVSLKVPKPQLWSPSSPTLYDLRVELRNGSQVVDSVDSYFGIREIALKKDKYGTRVYLNNAPVFMFGPLDQGWWPDGLYTPPTDDALRYDLEATKRMGFNTVRKHVKVEPARFYRHCDELGLLVWQDMPSNLKFPPGWNMDWRLKTNPKADGPRPADSKQRFEAEWKRILEACRPFPSIVVWVPFNEAWGQFDTKRVTEWTKALDPTRLVNSASGGNFVETGDILDIHVYPGPGAPDRQTSRAIVLGEFGGLGLPVEKHTWQDKNNWGYRNFTDAKEMMVRYEELIRNLVLLKAKGLSAAIYTQTTDVEGEVNGFLTYDRDVAKMPIDWLRKVNTTVYGPEKDMQAVLATADDKAGEWRYTETEPSSDWFSATFDASKWKKGKSGFGTEGTPGAVIGTTWSSTNIWIRREFEVTAVEGDLWLKIHHDEDASVYINGNLIAKFEGYVGSYSFKDIPDGVLQPGKNVIAVACKQTRGGQYIDAGIYKAVKAK